MKTTMLAVLAGVTALASAAPVQAQAFPSRSIRLVVPFPPGGGTDAISRILAQRLTDSVGQQVVVDNRGGAGGIIGTEIVAKAAPDGHTIGMIISAHSVNPALYKTLPFDSVASFAPAATSAKSACSLRRSVVSPATSEADAVVASFASSAFDWFCSPCRRITRSSGSMPDAASNAKLFEARPSS